MTHLPISNPPPKSRETLYSYLARLAATWQSAVSDLAYDMGAPFRRLLHHDVEAFGALADWAKLSPDTMAELLSWTGVRAGNVRMEFRGELYGSRSLRNPVIRGCPVCLREDAGGVTSPAFAAMVMRGGWQFREVTLCIHHGHPLVPLWRASAPSDRFDIGARLQEIEADILSGALDQPTRTPSAYDLWLDKRLEDGTDDTWLKDYPIFAVATFCRLLGQALIKEDNAADSRVFGPLHVAGFNVVVCGEAGIRDALDQLAAGATGALDEPSKAFGHLYKKLNLDYLQDEGFVLFRNILRDCIIDHWPIASGEVVLGEALPERRLHSLRTAAMETGVGAKVLENFLIEAAAIPLDDQRPDSRKLFDAQAHAALLAEIPALVGPIAMRKAMGATRMELVALTEAGVLIPRTQVQKVKNPWRISDGIALVAELSEGAVAVAPENNDWETVLLAGHRKKITLDVLTRAIREKQLTVGQRRDVHGFHGIVILKSEVDDIAVRPKDAHNQMVDDQHVSVAAAEFGRSIGLRDGGVFQAMIVAGHVRAYQIVNARTGRPQYRMAPEDMAAFHRRFVTLTTLSAETGQHRNTLKGLLYAHKIAPFSPQGKDFGAVYLREDVANVVG